MSGGSGTGTPSTQAGYCTLDEALSLIPTISSLRDAGTGITATIPSLTQAAAYVATVGSEIDLHLAGQGYDLPVTSAEALASLKVIAEFGVAALITRAAFPADDGIGGDKGSVGTWETKYQAGLKLIDDGLVIPDTASGGSAFAHGFPSADDIAAKDYPF